MGNGCNRIWEQGIMAWSCLTVTKSRHSISRHGESELNHCRHYGDGICPKMANGDQCEAGKNIAESSS
ncbi:hypothetical protein KIN20_010361 [Parelaphostrongylus tenuis]|uniref:Uncharacterized protein n=1 Tax=Parelaphostrongylus tenuis TaxID=148309 RepID=A0AAD5MRT9_PARTN|nr:hypothetical protein KIN20_010361 [Parelaphostrongylus tenuis]